jgi:hypothetical protein
MERRANVTVVKRDDWVLANLDLDQTPPTQWKKRRRRRKTK